jgi:hypothetical protein
MLLDPKLLVKVLSPKIAAKAVQSFDRATTIVVAACWGAAILMMAFAIYTTLTAVSAKRQAENAEIAEPSLPKVVRKNIEPRAAQGLVERLKRLYPDITFNLANNQALTVTAIDGSKFRQWLTALSYIDTISPEYHWTLTQFCVGK